MAPEGMILFVSFVAMLLVFAGAVLLLRREFKRELDAVWVEIGLLRQTMVDHRHTPFSGRVMVPRPDSRPAPVPPSSGPVCVISTREEVNPLAATVVAVAPDDRDTDIDVDLTALATTLPSAGEVVR